LKRVLTGIAAAGVVLGMTVPTAFAATNSSMNMKAMTWKQDQIMLGTSSIGFKGFESMYAGTETTYMPIYYLNEYLHKMGFGASWDGVNKVWSITTPTGVTVDTSAFGTAGQGTAGIYVNGTLVQMTTPKFAKDPASGVETTYMPIYFLLKVLQGIGVAQQSDWNGNTGVLTLVKPAVTTPTTSTGLSALSVSGQTLGSGTATSPYINETGTSETVSTMLTDAMGNPLTNATLDVTLVGGTAAPTVQQGSMYEPISSSTSNGVTTYTTSVTTDSNGKVSFTVSGEGVYQLTVAGTNGYSSDTQSTYIGMANGNPILSPSTMSTGFSSASNSTAGLVPVTVTLPESNNAPAANQEVTFYLVNSGGLDGMFTNAQGQSIGAAADSGSGLTSPAPAAAYTTYTNSDGQATAYVNAYEAGTATVYVAEGGNGTQYTTGVESTLTYSAPSTTTVTSAAGLAVGTTDFTTSANVADVNSVDGVSDSNNVYVAPLASTADVTDAMLTGDNVTYTLNFASGQNLSSISLDALNAAATSSSAVMPSLPTSATSASMVQVEAEYGTNNYTWWVNGVELMNSSGSAYTTALPVFGFQASAAGTVSIASGSAKATATFVGAPVSGTYTSYLSPNTIDVSTVGGSTTATFTVLDSSGNPVPNTSVPISYGKSLSGLWLTAVNGSSLSEYVTGSDTTEPTPIPLYTQSGLGYSQVSVPGVVSWNNSSNTFNVETGSNGQVTLSFATSGAPYWTTSGTTYGINYSTAPSGTPTATTYTYFGASTQPTQGVLYIGNTKPTSWSSVGSISW
jgi:hypothetical protein